MLIEVEDSEEKFKQMLVTNPKVLLVENEWADPSYDTFRLPEQIQEYTQNIMT